MRWSRTSRLLVALSLFGIPFIGKSQWVAFNDHAGTNTTHVNATRWNVFGTANGAPGASGSLRNINTGANLPVTLTIANSGAAAESAFGPLQPGNPAYTVFNGYVDFGGTPSPSVGLDGSDVVTYTFTGLNPAKRYNFKGTAVRGNSAYVDRWTLIEITGAVSAVPAHTANRLLTSNQVPTLSPTQCAINTGWNSDPGGGDYASWDQIQPSANGSFAVTSRLYTGAVPGGSSGGGKGYAITGIRLEELGTGVTPISIITQPQSRSVNVPTAVTLFVTVSGSTPAYQWYKNGSAISGKTNQFLQFIPSAVSDSGDYFVVVTNSANSVTSQIATLTVSLPPIVYTNIALTNASGNSVWKYNQSGAEPPADASGKSWEQPGYNDSSWPSGRGILALETGNAYVIARTNTVLSLTTGGGDRIISYYFRNTFVLTNDPSAVSVVVSNVIDDGAVIYLNGTEVRRILMANGNVNYSTLATDDAPEGAFTWTNFPTSLLIKGTNTIAVEVHQVNATSSDVVFGMEVTTVIPPPSILAIVSQPQSLVLEEDKDAVFTVGLTGGDPHIQWYKNGVAISNATQTTLTIPIVTNTDQGTYVFVATNIVNSVTSVPVTLTIYADTNRPVLVQADGTDSATNVLVSFSERILASTATNAGNYQITNTQGGAAIAITRATLLPNGTNVMLQTAARNSGENYILVVNRLKDLAIAQNVIATNSSTPIIQLTTLLAMNGFNGFRFYNPIPFYGDDPNLPADWTTLSYDDSGIPWGSGTSIFYDGSDEDSIPGTVGTHLDQSDAYISYYRGRFDLTASPGGLDLQLTHIVDDGAVFYLNGTEFARFNMPTGTITSATAASTTVANAGRVTVSIPSGLVVPGQNVIAVSLHQSVQTDVDRALGIELVGRAQSFVVGPVIITRDPQDITVSEGQTATFSVVSAGALRFQWQSNTVAIANGTNSGTYTTPRVTLAMNNTQYRVAVSNATTGRISASATLHVIADTNAPTLVSAKVASPTSVTVSFSEFMGTASAQTAGNYTVTNSSGTVVPVTSATLVDGTNVVLTFGSTLAGRYVVVVNNVADSSAAGNKIAPNSWVTVGADYSIPLISAWKYLLINTNDTVEETYYEMSYDDSAWSGPSNTLMYVEGANLPVAKNTPLSLTADDGGRINTYYFRQNFYAAIGSTSMTLHIRHVIDDGMVLYLNGREIYRFNMPLGAITAASQALSPAIGDASLLGPFDVVVTNLIGGTNLLAAEVHQEGTASSDVVFGLEITGSVPSIVNTNPPQPVQIVTQPQSRTNGVGSTASFSVTASGDPRIYYQWRTNGVNIPNATNATLNFGPAQLTDNGKAFTVIVSNFVNSVTSTVATLTVTNTVICTPISSWTNNFKLSVSVTNGTNIALTWANPVTNSCGSNAAVVLRHATAITPAGLSWTNIFTNATGPARVVITNGVTSNPAGVVRFYKLQVGP